MFKLLNACCLMLCVICAGCNNNQDVEEKKMTVSVNKAPIQSSQKKSDSAAPLQDAAYQTYIDFFEEVYDTMAENYYQPVSRENFDRFIDLFNDKIYGQLSETGKSIDFIRWRSTAFLIDHLKGSEDVFSAFYPPKPAKEYEATALGKRIDLGVEGNLTDQGFAVRNVEIRADAYEKGLRKNDVIVQIDDKDVASLDQSTIIDMLTPLEGEVVKLNYFASDGTIKTIEVVSREYFKQMTFVVPTKLPGVYGLRIKRFNRKTSEDMLRFLQTFKNLKPNGEMIGLILDLRDNPGGPPLAAREISSFFLTPGEILTYFKKHNTDKIELDIPRIPEQFHVRVPMVILIDENTGSAAEMFSGVMQRKGRAILMGENSAGQVMLKSMFHFDDESMLLLITQRGHYPDGGVFSFSGLTPERFNDQMDGDDIVDYASKYLLYIHKKSEKE